MAAMTARRTDRVVIVHPDPAVRGEIESVLRRVHRQAIAVRHVSHAGSAIQISREFDPRIVLLDLGQERALALSVARELRRPDRLLIGLINPLLKPLIQSSGETDSEAEFLRQAVRAGIGDFIALPLSDAEAAAALASLPETEAATHEGRAVAFFSHQGGVGTTTLAINTALALAAGEPARSVALFDANIQFGCVAAHLGLVPEHDLSDSLQDLALGGMSPLPMVGPGTGVAVLASPLDPNAAQRITPEDVSRALIELQRKFQIVVIDTAPVLDLMTLSLLDLSESIVVVTESTAPTIAGTARLLRMLASLGFGEDRVKLAVSRHRREAEVLAPEVVASQLERPVDHVIPFAWPVAVGTHRGMPALFERGATQFGDAVRKLARDVGRVRGKTS
jgi:pilus assembly protein CpaE